MAMTAFALMTDHVTHRRDNGCQHDQNEQNIQKRHSNIPPIR